jgi:U3 small nucleolar RNA-associated protein 4
VFNDSSPSDGTIVSGDSLGMVKFWDAVTCTQLQSFSAHGADILALAIGPQGDSLYTAGVDQNITEFLAVNVGANVPGRSTGKRRWTQSCFHHRHSHDVRSLATWPPYVPIAGGSKKHLASTPILVSGGLDMSLILSPIATPSPENAGLENVVSQGSIATFEEGHYRRLQFVQRVVQVAHRARILACMNDSTVSLWKIDSATAQTEGEEPPGSWAKLAELNLKVKTNLTACALSSDGTWLAVADLYETKLFRLENVSSHSAFVLQRW